MSGELDSTKIPDPQREDLASDERWKLALRISVSKEFSKAAKLRSFLQYVCWNTLSDRTEELHEQQIGRAVFGRRPDYNPAEDNIVRVEARELRKRLDRYFLRQGSTEPLRIVIPKGSYSARFEPNPRVSQSKEVPATPAESPARNSLKKSADSPKGDTERSWRGWRFAVLLASLLVLLVSLYWFVGRAGKTTPQPPASKSSPEASVWHLLFPGTSTLSIVSADSSLVLVEYISHKTLSLADYLSSQYDQTQGNPVLQRIVPNPYVDLSDLRITAKIVHSIGPLDINVQVRYPRYINLTDLDTGNLVLLGSAFSDPWINKFHPKMNFVVQMDQKSQNLCFVNKKPKPGELDRYCAEGGPGQEDVTYGLVTYLPNLQHTGNILLLAGTTGGGTEAAGDFMTDPHYAASLLHHLNLKPQTRALPYFQILLKTVVLNNAPGNLTVIAHRIIRGQQF